MKRWLGLFLGLVLAANAQASTYYVDWNNGSDGHTGGSLAQAKQTLHWVNKNAKPGDLIFVYPSAPNTYDEFPNPDSGGSNPTGGGYIRIIGQTTTGDPTLDTTSTMKIRIPGGSLNSPYIVLQGLCFTNGFSFDSTAWKDSVKYCYQLAGDNNWGGADYCVFEHNYCRSQRIFKADHGLTQHYRQCGNDIEWNVWPLLGKDVVVTPTNASPLFSMGCSCDAQASNTGGFRVDSLTFMFNRITGYVPTSPQGLQVGPRIDFHVSNCKYKYNKEVYFMTDSRSPFVSYTRDSSSLNVFTGDTILTYGPGLSTLELCGVGAWGNSCDQNTRDSCVISLRTLGGGDILSQNRLNRFKFRWNQVVLNGTMTLNDIKGNTDISHNTIIGNAEFGVLQIPPPSANQPAWNDTVKIRSNWIQAWKWTGYSSPPRLGEAIPPTCQYQQGYPPGCGISFAARYDPGTVDSVRYAGGGISRMHQIDWNGYGYHGYSTAPGDRSILYWAGNYANSAPGTSGPWFSNYKKDSLSVWGTLGATDSTYDYTSVPNINYQYPNYNLKPTVYSHAISKGLGELGSTTIGAISYATAPQMSINPTGSVMFEAGQPGQRTFRISNVGGANLVVSSIVKTGCTCFSVSPASATIAASATQDVTVTYDGTGGGGSTVPTGLITLTSNDYTYPTLKINVYATVGGGGKGPLVDP